MILSSPPTARIAFGPFRWIQLVAAADKAATLAFSPDSQVLGVFGEAPQFWHLPEGIEIKALERTASPKQRAFCFGQDGKSIFVADGPTLERRLVVAAERLDGWELPSPCRAVRSSRWGQPDRRAGSGHRTLGDRASRRHGNRRIGTAPPCGRFRLTDACWPCRIARIELWDLRRSLLLDTLEGHWLPVTALEFLAGRRPSGERRGGRRGSPVDFGREPAGG